jgi:hypothetical protein
MLRKLLVGIALTLLVVTPALAQETESAEAGEAGNGEPSSRGWGLHAGYLIGDEISEESFGDELQFKATLEDDAAFGGSFWADMNETWRFEIRLNYVPATISNVAPLGWNEDPDVDGPARTLSADMFYLDVGFIPYFDLSESLRLGIPFGLGWAALYADEVFSDFVPERSIGLQQEDGSGATYYLGLQLTYEMNDRWELFVDGRFKRFHRLASILERTAKTNEFTVGFMKRF